MGKGKTLRIGGVESRAGWELRKVLSGEQLVRSSGNLIPGSREAVRDEDLADRTILSDVLGSWNN